MKIWRKTLGASAALALVATTYLAVGEAEATGVFHQIKNVNSNMCLQPEGASAGVATIVQARCNGGLAQAWLFQQISGSIYKVINQNSGRCMYMNGPVAPRSPIAQVGCGTFTNFWWEPLPGPVSVGILKSRAGSATNLCLDVPGGQSTEGLPVQTFTCNGTPAQAWVMGF